jgi:precorrin-2/cobalt-factor-2 C20-methyltransferase
MKKGTLYGIGLGPGDPDLITVKGVAILQACRHVFVPRTREGQENAVLAIAEKHINPDAEIHEIVFGAAADRTELSAGSEDSARRIAEVLESGEDACVIARGDILLYSPYTQVLSALRRRMPELEAITIPGISAFSAAAALANCPLGRGKQPITIVPSADDLEGVRRAVSEGGTVVVLDIGRRLGGILDILENAGVIGRSVFVSRAGIAGQRVESDLRNLRGHDSEAQHLSTILIKGKRDESRRHST